MCVCVCVCVYTHTTIYIYNISNIYIPHLLRPLICWWILGCFHVLATVNSAAVNTGCMYLYELWFIHILQIKKNEATWEEVTRPGYRACKGQGWESDLQSCGLFTMPCHLQYFIKKFFCLCVFAIFRTLLITRHSENVSWINPWLGASPKYGNPSVYKYTVNTNSGPGPVLGSGDTVINRQTPFPALVELNVGYIIFSGFTPVYIACPAWFCTPWGTEAQLCGCQLWESAVAPARLIIARSSFSSAEKYLQIHLPFATASPSLLQNEIALSSHVFLSCTCTSFE